MMRCFLDLAGVLTDWNTAAHRVHGLPFSNEDYPYPRGLWDWVSLLPTPEIPLSQAAFFAPLGREFYASLPWMPDGKEILDCVASAVGHMYLYILTTPLKTPGSIEGTLEWVTREIPFLADRIVITHAKEVCACSEAILIDDKEENVDIFNAHGGYGVLVPRIWNRYLNYKEAAPTFIKSYLEGILDES